jgi:hypothetical protein
MTSFIFKNFGQPTCTELIALLNAVCCTQGACAICCRHSLSKVHVTYTDDRCVHSVLTPFMQVFGSVKEPFGHSSRFNLMWARVASSNGNGDVPRTSLMCIFKPICLRVVYVYHHPCGPGRFFDISRYFHHNENNYEVT